MKEEEKRRMTKCRIISDERDKYRKTNVEKKYVEEGDRAKKDVSAVHHLQASFLSNHRYDSIGVEFEPVLIVIRNRPVTEMIEVLSS